MRVFALALMSAFVSGCLSPSMRIQSPDVRAGGEPRVMPLLRGTHVDVVLLEAHYRLNTTRIVGIARPDGVEVRGGRARGVLEGPTEPWFELVPYTRGDAYWGLYRSEAYGPVPDQPSHLEIEIEVCVQGECEVVSATVELNVARQHFTMDGKPVGKDVGFDVSGELGWGPPAGSAESTPRGEQPGPASSVPPLGDE